MDNNFFASLKTAVDFYILRHGQSEGNAGKILQGRFEYPLSETGRMQAAARGRALKKIMAGPEKQLFFSSPQSRARETALIIAEEAGLPPPVFIDSLLEMNLGIWTGKNWEQVKSENPSLWTSFMAKSWDAIPEAESSAALYNRALHVWALLCDAATESGAKKVVAVTHGGLIQWLLKSTFQCHTWFPLFPISNCGLFKLCVEPHQDKQNAYMCWEEIDSTLPGIQAESRGFPS